MKNLNESLLENIELIEEMQLQTELDVIFAIGNQYAKVGMIAEYSETDINEYDIIQESTLFMEADDSSDKNDNDKKDKKKGFWGKIKKFFSTIGKAIVKAFKWIGRQFKKLGKWVKSWFKKKDDDISNKEAAKMLDLGPFKDIDNFIEKKEEVVNNEITPEEAKQLVDEAEQILDNAKSKMQEASGDATPEDAPTTQSVPQIGTSSDNDEAVLAQELEQHKQELEQLKNDPEYQKNANAMADKVYEIVFKMNVYLRKIYKKFDRAYGNTTEETGERDEKILERIVYDKYKTAEKDKNFQNAVKAFAKEFGIKEPTMETVFTGMADPDKEGGYLFLQKCGVSYDPDFLKEMLSLTNIINNFQEKNIITADNYINHIINSRVYYFADLSEELLVQENEQVEALDKAVAQCENFNPADTAIESSDVARFATRLEREALPHITTKLSEMAAYQNFLTSVFVEFRKQVTQNTQAKEGN